MNKLLISDVCKKFGVTKVTVLNWIEAGFFPKAKLNTSGLIPFWEIPADEVEAFVKPTRGRPKHNLMEVNP